MDCKIEKTQCGNLMLLDRRLAPNCSFQQTRLPTSLLHRRPQRAAELGVRLSPSICDDNRIVNI